MKTWKQRRKERQLQEIPLKNLMTPINFTYHQKRQLTDFYRRILKLSK